MAEPLFSSWDSKFIALAELVGSWTKLNSDVGAVIVRPDNTVASLGYAGFPRGIIDTPGRLASTEMKRRYTVHAELNAILSAREPLHGYTMYISPYPPCYKCVGAIIQSGIGRVVISHSKKHEVWSNTAPLALFYEAGVEVLI